MVLAACVLGILAPVAASGAPGRHARPKLVVLIVAGQSNALGYQSYVVDPKTHKDIFTDRTKSAADHHVLLAWDESGVAGGGVPPALLDAPQRLSGAPSPVFGPEVGLARYLYANGHHNLMIVKVAFSGSSLSEDWVRGAPDYVAMTSTVTAALSWSRTQGYVPSIGGVYWMQGETDAMTAAAAAAYGANLKQFLANVRHSFGLTTTPFVIGQIDLADYIEFEQVHGLCPTPSCGPEKLWNTEVMDAQAKAAAPLVFVAKTAKLSRYDDFLHLTDAAELQLGKVMGQLTAKHLT